MPHCGALTVVTDGDQQGSRGIRPSREKAQHEEGCARDSRRFGPEVTSTAFTIRQIMPAAKTTLPEATRWSGSRVLRVEAQKAGYFGLVK
jgi:hypothetical protein